MIRCLSLALVLSLCAGPFGERACAQLPTAQPGGAVSAPGTRPGSAAPSGYRDRRYTGPGGGASPGYNGPAGGGSGRPDGGQAGGGGGTAGGGNGGRPAGGGGLGGTTSGPPSRPPVGPIGGGRYGGPQGGSPRPGPGPGDPPDGDTRPRRRIAPPRTDVDHEWLAGELGLPYETERWENWWILNRHGLLEVDRAYSTRVPAAPSDRDLFLGGSASDSRALPVARHRELLRPRIAPLLRRHLKDPAAIVRGEAALALGKIGDEHDVPVLIGMTDDTDAYVRHMALLGLGMTRATVATETLHEFLDSSQTQDRDRAYAALALGIGGDPLAEGALASVLARSGQHREVQAAVTYALGFVAGEGGAALLRDRIRQTHLAGDLRAVAVLALAKRGQAEDCELLIGLLRDPQSHVRRSAVLGLGQLDFTSPLWNRRSALLDKVARWEREGTLSAEARREFEGFLASIEEAATRDSERLAKLELQAVKALARQLVDGRDPMISNFAAVALGRIGSPEARTALSLANRRGSVASSTRSFLALALGLCRAQEAADIFRADLAAERLIPTARAARAIALGLMGDTSAGPVLANVAIGRGDPELRGFAAIATGMLDWKGAAMAFRQQLLQERSVEMRPEYGLALALMGDVEGLRALERIAQSDAGSHGRVLVMRALAELRDLASVDVLMTILARGAEETDRVRGVALHALGQVAEKSSLPAIEPLARDWNYLLPFPVITDALRR